MYLELCIFKHGLTLLTSELSAEYGRYLVNNTQYFCIYGIACAPVADAAIAYVVTAMVLNVCC